ncbi:MAG: sulfatase-like hydrolase/transferase, partial [Anaerolineales bacterium]
MKIFKPIIIYLSIVLLFSNCTNTPEKSITETPTISPDSPNIIFILTDDQRWDAIGYASNPIIYTPEMDRMAEQGCYFDNAFVTTPICAASRASVMTGLYERTHRFTFGTPPLKKEYIDHSYPKLLKDAGYKNGFIGKFGMSFQNSHETTLIDKYRRPGEQTRRFYPLASEN